MALPSDSHTARRLQHATPDHLHLTTRRAFIGPIPEGWLKSHRKQWYRHYITQSASRAPTFTAAHPIEESNDRGVQSPAVDPVRTSSTSDNRMHESPASTTSLLQEHNTADAVAQEPPEPNSVEEQLPAKKSNFPNLGVQDRMNTARVRFSEPRRLELRARARRVAAHGRLRGNKFKDGEVLKLEKMLVRIDITQQQLRDDYDEKASQGVETKQMDKWREFMVVCRKHTVEDAECVLQLYQTRVITATTGDKQKKRPKVEIYLSPRRAKVNLFSSLDKTIAVWTYENARTTIYYLRPQSSATSVEWYTFLHTMLGTKRAQELQVNIPDLRVSLRLDDPFKALETSATMAQAAEGDDDALARAISDEQGVAGAIVTRCLEMLEKSPEWADVLNAWATQEKIGLAWKRYDRIEWVHGANESKMYGTIGMSRTHDLELRPKQHKPTSTKTHKGHILDEPAPIEGFLIRLTSQKGNERKGKLFFKRLYFTTQNQHLLFLRPARVTPPPPPRMPAQANGNVPSSRQIADKIPLIYDINPYPVHHGEIDWLDAEDATGPETQLEYDQKAAAEAERNFSMLMACDGLINLTEVKHVRDLRRGATPADDNVDDGSDVDFDVEVSDSHHDDGQTTEIDDERTFELLMRNGLVIRLQSYNKETKTVWMQRLRKLVKYWSHRAAADMDLYKSVRQQNLKALNIDERAEAVVGQFAYKWEVSQSYASPELYNMCGITGCRTIHLSGVLFRKPRRHSTFSRCHVVLSNGHLLIFQDSLRTRTGKKLVHIQHERIASIDLRDCYLYSGLITENDLLYQNRTFDSNTPGHNALPRIYLEDGWTSTDEDAMTCFVIWRSQKKSWFKSSQSMDDIREGEKDQSGKRQQLKRVSALGATGRSVVFKARSRAERDHWVLAIQVEIERLAAMNEEVRVVDEVKK